MAIHMDANEVLLTPEAAREENIKEFFIPKLEKNTPPKSRDNPSEIAKDLVF